MTIPMVMIRVGMKIRTIIKDVMTFIAIDPSVLQNTPSCGTEKSTADGNTYTIPRGRAISIDMSKVMLKYKTLILFCPCFITMKIKTEKNI